MLLPLDLDTNFYPPLHCRDMAADEVCSRFAQTDASVFIFEIAVDDRSDALELDCYGCLDAKLP